MANCSAPTLRARRSSHNWCCRQRKGSFDHQSSGDLMSFPELVGVDKFAQGKLTYSDHLGHESRIARIVVTAVFGHNMPITAIVDTGAPWCIVGPEEAEGIDPN